MYDLLITNALIVDGTGADRFVGTIAITDGKIAAIGTDIVGDATQVIDASGRLVTPGFVDIHTHYDGQVTWDPVLEPSSLHGVTTVVMGNCGVGFAPVHPGKEDWLIQLMEGVEDIPGAALAEGISWGWESFPEYLDVLDKLDLSLDIGAQVSHGAVRGYVMGDRGARNEPATPEDIAQMKAIVKEALEAGAMGFSTSRTIAHRAIDGEPVPGTYAAEDELFGIGEALGELGKGVFELAPTGAAGEDIVAPWQEVDWMKRLSAQVKRPVTFALVQCDAAPELWRELMDASMEANNNGAQLYPQIANRPNGILMGLQTNHPFASRPSFEPLKDVSLAEKVTALRDPAFRARLLAEESVFTNPFAEYLGTRFDRIYVLGNPPDYEPGPESTVAAIAAAEGVDVQEKLLELLLEADGKALLMFPFLNYSHSNADAAREMLLHPAGVAGLSDGGAHCGNVCDASMPTWMLTHWARDRSRGEQLPLEFVVKKQSHDTARLFGMTDRGTLEVGMKADINVIDFEALALHPPELVHDLPAGGARLVQGATGYDYTIVSGVIARQDGLATGARPGRLVRS